MNIKERLAFVSLTVVSAIIGGAISGHIFGTATVDAAAHPHAMIAQKFVLVDPHGRTRGVLDVTEKGVAQLGLFDGSGTLRAGLGVGVNGAPALGIYDKNGKTRAELGMAGGVSEVHLYDANGVRHVALGVSAEGVAGLALLDKDGHSRASLILEQAGTPALRFADTSGASRIGINVTPDGLPGIALLAGGKTRAAMTLNADGAGAVTIYDETGGTKASLP